MLPENKEISGHDIIVIGASAGGVEALSQLVRHLPPDLPAAVFVVLHVSPHSPSMLPKILSRVGKLPAVHPQDGAAIQHGQIYVAPPDNHLLIKRGHIHLARGPKENSHRPAVDPLFRTAARAYGRRVVGVILSGSLDDGTAGMIAIKRLGGKAITQDPEEALYVGMPRSVIEHVEVDYILPIAEIAAVLVDLAYKPVEEKDMPVPENIEGESEIAELEMAALNSTDHPGKPSGFACPDCGGALWELKHGKLIRFRCRVGHAYSVDTLLAEQSEVMEMALWNALRALEESAALAKRLADNAQKRNHGLTAERFKEQAQEAEQNAAVIRQVLLKDATSATAKIAEADPAVAQAQEVEQRNPR